MFALLMMSRLLWPYLATAEPYLMTAEGAHFFVHRLIAYLVVCPAIRLVFEVYEEYLFWCEFAEEKRVIQALERETEVLMSEVERYKRETAEHERETEACRQKAEDVDRKIEEYRQKCKMWEMESRIEELERKDRERSGGP